MTEIWKELEGFSKYKFSNSGKVWSKHYNREMSLKPTPEGYIQMELTNNEGNKKNYRIHRLVALTFIPNPEKKPTVNHKNHNRADNRVENLEWATVAEQNNHSRKASKEVTRLQNSRAVWRCSIDGKKIEYYETMQDASQWVLDNKGNKRARNNISTVCRNKQKTAYGFKWIYDTSDENIFENEIWKDIPKELIKGYSSYKISDQGRIKNPRGKILKGYDGKYYKNVSIGTAAGKTYFLHRLVAQVFLPNFYNKPFVNHKDHDRSNCKLYNLEWVTPSENSIAAVNHYSSKKD
ncbi:MAG: hypothetical protein Ct9H90mP28_2310 [Paracoccaceae bacterium]|nr:MAG: hypothetical protein Ct9H90mP28_2310 [Paracoccaceae bacterium]